MTLRPILLASALTGPMLLAACSLAPDYKPPAVAIPTAYKENAGTPNGPWQPAKPSDALPRGDWWRDYRDTTLDTLEAKIDIDNPDRAVALARYDQARAYAAQANASMFPFVSIDASASRDRQSDQRPTRGAGQPNQYGANTIDAQISYDFDFWGKIRNTVADARAMSQASAADLEGVRLGLHAELATDYVKLRGLDAEEKLLNDTVAAYSKAATLTQDRYQGKIASGIDVSRAQSQLDSARALISDVAADRALLEHAIASLVGQPASNFTLAPAVVTVPIPHTPLALPSTLLQRRPDIAAAERQVAAANAGIGVAKAAFYPDISLGLMGGFQDTGSVHNLLMAPFSFWSLGPQLAAPLFEGGLRHAQEAGAYAVFDQASNQYRSTVLAAFQEVEDNLALLNHLGQEGQDEASAVAAAEHTANLSLNLYKNGALSYLDVVVAQTDALQAERTQIALNTRRLEASIHLVRALGGGWSTASLPSGETAGQLSDKQSSRS
jgi:NodT family efflux transporter outer membrane factor (OMF) lipoprotein